MRVLFKLRGKSSLFFFIGCGRKKREIYMYIHANKTWKSIIINFGYVFFAHRSHCCGYIFFCIRTVLYSYFSCVFFVRILQCFCCVYIWCNKCVSQFAWVHLNLIVYIYFWNTTTTRCIKWLVCHFIQVLTFFWRRKILLCQNMKNIINGI